MHSQPINQINRTAKIIYSLISFYQKYIGLFLKPACRFYPSCSQYAKDALMTHNTLKSFYLIGRRLLRCHPLCAGGFDPVISEKGHKQNGC